MAIDILLIPLMSDKLERVFSGARRIVSWDRGQMEAETIKIRECLKHQKRSGILETFFDTTQVLIQSFYKKQGYTRICSLRNVLERSGTFLVRLVLATVPTLERYIHDGTLPSLRSPIPSQVNSTNSRRYVNGCKSEIVNYYQRDEEILWVLQSTNYFVP